MQQRSYIHAVHVQYRGLGNELIISVDGVTTPTMHLPDQSLQRRRVTLPSCLFGTFPQFSFNTIEPDNLLEFERLAETSYQEQQLFHYFEIGYRGNISVQIQNDSVVQGQTINTTATTNPDTLRIYFNPLSYGFIPHLHNTGDGEILWAKPIALPPRFFRGIRTHAEFQITYVGDVELQWYLDGVDHGDPYVLPTVSSVTTQKLYFPAGTIGHILQYRVTNPTEGRVYVVETDVTLADLEQQTMTQNTEERV